jgi:hypothetical protein
MKIGGTAGCSRVSDAVESAEFVFRFKLARVNEDVLTVSGNLRKHAAVKIFRVWIALVSEFCAIVDFIER